MSKQIHRTCEISKHHKAAKILSPKSIESVTEMKWKVLSQSKNTQYTVAQDCDCKILCKDLSICPHTYSCTCLDATLHATVCKHIHMETNSGYSSDKGTTKVDYSYFNNVLFSQKKKNNAFISTINPNH